MRIELEITDIKQKGKFQKIFPGTFTSVVVVIIAMVSLTTTRVETFFGELEYINEKLVGLLQLMNYKEPEC